MAGGQGVPGASVVFSLERPDGADTYEDGPVLPVARTGSDGRFALPLVRGRILPGAWTVSARVLATTASQRVDETKPIYFTLGPQRDIALMRRVQRAQALAVPLDSIDDDTLENDRNARPSRMCTTALACFGRSTQLRQLVSRTSHPAPGHAGYVVRALGNYSIVTRVPTSAFRLEFVLTVTPDDATYTCRGDLAARRRWCPGGTWDDIFNDPFVTAGVDGTPFDY
jgi:hypothetical protein